MSTVRFALSWCRLNVLFVLAVPLAFCATMVSAASTASNKDEWRYVSGIRLAPGKFALSDKQAQRVLQSLRAKTGWESLTFDARGFLLCPDPRTFAGGSASARTLLAAALASADVFELQQAARSAQIAFARLESGINYRSLASGKQIVAYPLQLDFNDFQELRGDGEALAAFDVGLMLLHELAHGVWRLRDAASTAEEPGECETYINQIRRELQLPERTTYYARLRPRPPISFTQVSKSAAELVFAQRGAKKTREFSLQWAPETVGGQIVQTLVPPSVLTVRQGTIRSDEANE